MITNNGARITHSPSPTPAQVKHPEHPLPKPEVGTRGSVPKREFDQPVILQQSGIWSQAILWVLMGTTTGLIIWASVAKIEEAIPAQGKLEPQDAVKEVQAPVGGVVKTIYVEDGQKVRAGERLISLEPTATQAELNSLKKIRTALIQENDFYRAQMNGLPDSVAVQAMAQLKLPLELISLTKSRATLVAENQLYRTQLNGSAPVSLTSAQIERLRSNQAELTSRVVAARLQGEQLTKQLSQTQIKLAGAKDTLAMNKEILSNIEPLAKQGALSRIQYIKQRQEVRTNLVETEELTQEQQRLKLAINEAQSKLENALTLDRKELLTQIADNDKRIAEIDSQLTKAIVENNKSIAETDSKLSQAEQTLKYQELRAPVSGTVFDLQAHSPGFVTNSTTPVLKIVPDDALTAKVFITNRDIGFVREGMKVDVRIDSFPFSEFGDIKGELVSVGSDALPPDQIRQEYTFPAKIRIDRQSLSINDRAVPLQSGMSLSANIKVRSRTVMSIFTDLFTKKIESLKFVR